jgi:hypothetical protein
VKTPRIAGEMSVIRHPYGTLTEDLLSSIVTDVVCELQMSMAGFCLSKSAQAEVMKSVVKHPEPKRGVMQLLTDSLWEHQLRNIVYSRLQTYVPKPHCFVPADYIKEPVSYIRRAQVCDNNRSFTSGTIERSIWQFFSSEPII